MSGQSLHGKHPLSDDSSSDDDDSSNSSSEDEQPSKKQRLNNGAPGSLNSLSGGSLSAAQLEKLSKGRLKKSASPMGTPPNMDPKSKKKGKGGSSCHQCKSRRNFIALTYCTSNLDRKNKNCRKKFCEHCLKKFYKESPVQIPDKNNWKCPSCRKICCCAACRRRKMRDTGAAVPMTPPSGPSKPSSAKKPMKSSVMTPLPPPLPSAHGPIIHESLRRDFGAMAPGRPLSSLSQLMHHKPGGGRSDTPIRLRPDDRTCVKSEEGGLPPLSTGSSQFDFYSTIRQPQLLNEHGDECHSSCSGSSSDSDSDEDMASITESMLGGLDAEFDEKVLTTEQFAQLFAVSQVPRVYSYIKYLLDRKDLTDLQKVESIANLLRDTVPQPPLKEGDAVVRESISMVVDSGDVTVTVKTEVASTPKAETGSAPVVPAAKELTYAAAMEEDSSSSSDSDDDGDSDDDEAEEGGDSSSSDDEEATKDQSAKPSGSGADPSHENNGADDGEDDDDDDDEDDESSESDSDSDEDVEMDQHPGVGESLAVAVGER